MPFDANALELPISVKLAGHAGRPTPVELREWLKNPDKANRSAVKELFEGLPGAYLVRLRQCCGGSIYELARLFHHCGIDHWMPVLWIDQFSNDRSKDRSIPQYYE
ncbi:MAG: hypothetical protein F4X44_13155 [Gammaproteobacteria bacterium]|nr:hypothetical protein [Gammaproteobacteria bacterium]